MVFLVRFRLSVGCSVMPCSTSTKLAGLRILADSMVLGDDVAYEEDDAGFGFGDSCLSG